ncbi:N-acetyl-gamma-glutamyl-phosphate reductase [Haliangium ochraceum]|uniref:N-acetyl-gamma-glutamyl-phosphate reductase n=1 Tax=Haliangium ochraceum (strain DSM 14365 / JCM 11303 / SMP-2) TaxID=502025 RepID=D0LU59_HALO1|nr:N-acetyl-gamma-glutamyl-phosphate reductase [Haliangium ochraceum]ACY17423.1 N-acetyl-gamma-glutamyl-phosphate reductase [Haliangium ochraceum DSM 14365]
MSDRKPFRAALIGGSGYGGGEIMRRLLLHPQVELARVASIDYVGEPIWAPHPNLTGLSELRFENISPREAAEDCDVALLALPHKVTAAKVPELVAMGVKIVDMSGDFRVRDLAAYEHYYATKHPEPQLLGQFVYGLPELNRERIRAAKYVASPGCFATTIELALLPLAKDGLLSGPVHVAAATGSSGSGAAAKAGTHHPTRAVNLKTYKPLAHQHTPEITQALHDAGADGFELRFVPISAPLSRGILATAFVEVADSVGEEHIAELFRASYADEPFVRVVRDRFPEVAAVAGSNYVEVGFAVGESAGGTRTVTCFAALDNLIKGGAGQAVQNMNLVLGLDERESLRDPGSWP